MTRIIGICSGKGGVGKTTFTANLALALRNFQQRVVVVDCNLSTPHLSYYLGAMDYDTTINDVLKGKADIMTAVPSIGGLTYIPASMNLNDLENVNVMNLKKHIGKLESSFVDFVLLDSAPGLGREAMSVLDAANEIIFLTTPTVPNLKDIQRVFEVSKEFGSKKFTIVLNMVNSGRYEFRPEEVEHLVKLPIFGVIPFDRNVIDSSAIGEPIIKNRPDSIASQHYMKVAANLVGYDYEIRRSIFQSFFDRFRR